MLARPTIWVFPYLVNWAGHHMCSRFTIEAFPSWVSYGGTHTDVTINWRSLHVGWMLTDHSDRLSSSKFIAWSSTAQLVCQRAFSLLAIWFWAGFKSCIQQRKTTCLLLIRKSPACTRALKLMTTNMYIIRARCKSQLAVGSSGLNAQWSVTTHGLLGHPIEWLPI